MAIITINFNIIYKFDIKSIMTGNFQLNSTQKYIIQKERRITRWKQQCSQILFLFQKKSHILKKKGIIGSPDLLCEIILPSTVHKDYYVKKTL